MAPLLKDKKLLVMKTKFSIHILTFMVVGHDMSSYILEGGLRVIQNVYQNILATKSNLRLKKVLQEKRASPHTIRKLRKWFKDNFFDHVTPPNLPKCNPFEYYAWGTIESIINKTACNNKGELRKISRHFKTCLLKLQNECVLTSKVAWRPWLMLKVVSLNKFHL